MSRDECGKLRSRSVRCMHQSGKDHELIRQRPGEIAVETQQVPGMLEWMGDQATGDHRTDGMELVFEGSHNAEITATAAHGPEKITILPLVRRQNLSIGSDNLDR